MSTGYRRMTFKSSAGDLKYGAGYLGMVSGGWVWGEIESRKKSWRREVKKDSGALESTSVWRWEGVSLLDTHSRSSPGKRKKNQMRVSPGCPSSARGLLVLAIITPLVLPHNPTSHCPGSFLLSLSPDSLVNLLLLTHVSFFSLVCTWAQDSPGETKLMIHLVSYIRKVVKYRKHSKAWEKHCHQPELFECSA